MLDANAIAGSATLEMLPHLMQVPELNRLRWVVPNLLPPDKADAWRNPSVDPDGLAVLVFTSGSVSSPRGVMISHRNLFYWAEAALCVQDVDEQDRVVVVTAPQYSSSFLAGMVFPVYGCISATHVAPEAISARPARWLETISRTRATISSAANFLFDVSVRSISLEARDALDLSCVRNIRNRGESVRADTIERFEAYFAPCG
jgi:acyl-CoA synthetase (AMP-forming)/AMP-acid ligase II